MSRDGAPDAARGTTAAGLFNGDTGALPVETRRTLVQLLLGPSVDSRRHSRLWPILLRDEEIIRSRLHDLFLDLILDREQGVAFTRQVVAGEIDVPVLLRRASLTFIESALVLWLRQALTQADARGERAVVSADEMTEHLAVYERVGNMDRARFARQCQNAVEKVRRLGLLHKLRASDDRFEISPTLKLLFPAEEIQTLTRTFAAIAAGEKTGAAHTDDDDDDAADAE